MRLCVLLCVVFVGANPKIMHAVVFLRRCQSFFKPPPLPSALHGQYYRPVTSPWRHGCKPVRLLVGCNKGQEIELRPFIGE